jgi:hypothetical protein
VAFKFLADFDTSHTPQLPVDTIASSDILGIAIALEMFPSIYENHVLKIVSSAAE